MKGFKELLEECKEFVADDPVYYGLELSTKDVRLIVEALEKQVAKKVIRIQDDIAKCPYCESYEIYYFEEDLNFNYCPECGTKLDWSGK